MNKKISSVRLAQNDFEFIYCEIKKKFIKNKVVSFLSKEKDSEKKDIAKYISKNRMSIFPYPYVNNYKLQNVEAAKDSDADMFYIQRNGRRLYMKKSYTSMFRAKRYYNNILIEQDEASPHRYVSDTFAPEAGSVILDVGGAEGFFPFDYLDTVDKVYIFECDDEWIEALTKTYADYKDKVIIINKFVSDFTDDSHITIDDFVQQYNLNGKKLFIKIDAEGSEPNIIRGARKTLNKIKNIWLALCTYHCAKHEALFRNLFKSWRIEASDGYMLYYYDFNFREPYLRKGILRITKV